jgi:hypothetical protein
MTLKEHLETLRRYAPSIDFDCILLNNRRISDEQTEAYAREGAEQIGLRGSIEKGPIEGARLVYTDLLEEGEKVRHDPDKLARAVLQCGRAPVPTP